VLFPLFAAKTVCEAGCRVGHELAWLFKAAGMVHVFEGGGAKIRGMKSVLWLRDKAAVWRIILLVFLSLLTYSLSVPRCTSQNFIFQSKSPHPNLPVQCPLNPSCEDVDKEIPTR